MKKVLSFFLAVIIAAIFAVPAYADTSSDDFGTYLVNKIKSYIESEIDISKYVDKYKWSTNDIKNEIADVFYSHPELFFIDNYFTLFYEGTKVVAVKFDYVIPKSKLAAAQKKIDDAAKKAVEGITKGMSDVDKALYVHDYIILNCRYDNSQSKYNAYNCLVEGTSVCQGYSLAYSYILNNYLGIECSAAYSLNASHIWNYVKIGKKWYHVDLTFDDVNDSAGTDSSDRYGGIYHDNFLMSDSKCRKISTSHKTWRLAGNYGAANDTSYDNAFWNGVNSALCYVDGNYYYIKNGGRDSYNYSTIELRRYNIKDQTSTIFAKLKSKWYCLRSDSSSAPVEYGKKVYENSYSSLAYKDGKLYLNSNKMVYSYNLSTKAVKKLYTLNKGEEMQIFGMNMVGGKLRIAYRKDLTYPENYLKLVLK